MMPIADNQMPQPEQHQVDYKQKYKALKKKLKFLVYEQECFLEELRKAQRKLLKISRDRSFLLDRLLQHEKIDESSGDSDATASSDSEVESQSSRKRKAGLSPGQGGDPSAILGSLGTPGTPSGASSLLMAAEPAKKKSKSSAKKAVLSKGGKVSQVKEKASHMTREELERHLESRQNVFGIEKAPMMLPMEIFSNDNSNPDSESALENLKEEEDCDLIVDSGQ
ncbi:INO80 complex subunit E-like [Ylistrum balloti]|uniref:INO80 complex subunit E-like n=1 Tax=Ylistrum balloti TaxID=509963 RepID=UPI0029059FCE|nr:INO80 complex subunit E-like [Ylistrum balloti]